MDPRIPSIIQKRLDSFMTRLDQENRGNRVSLELLQGIGVTLSILINDVVEEVQALALEDSKKGQSLTF